MRNNNEILLEIEEQEKSLNLYDFKFLGVSVWRLIRFPIRVNKLNSETGYVNSNLKQNIPFKEILYNYTISFFHFLSIILRRKKYKYLILAFPRMSLYNREYYDKFTDPLITQSNLKNQSLVLQRNLTGKHFRPRINAGADYRVSDFTDYTSKLLGVLILPIIVLFYWQKINELVKKASSYFSLSVKDNLIISFKIGEFLANYFFSKLILSASGVKQIFLVNRIIFLPFIRASKIKGIKVLELQHGITHSETELYTGHYQKEIDPDLFLNFGSKWIGEQFSIPIENQINIGWSYNSWLLNKMKVKMNQKTILVVSSPAITDKILKTTVELAKKYEHYIFNIRLHPQESLSQVQNEQLTDLKNIFLDKKERDSLVSVLENEFVIGENSSVLYEALSIGKSVGKIMFNGLHSMRKLDSEFKGLTYLYKLDDFSFLISNTSENILNSSGIYDIFDAHKFNNLLK